MNLGNQQHRRLLLLKLDAMQPEDLREYLKRACKVIEDLESELAETEEEVRRAERRLEDVQDELDSSQSDLEDAWAEKAELKTLALELAERIPGDVGHMLVPYLWAADSRGVLRRLAWLPVSDAGAGKAC